MAMYLTKDCRKKGNKQKQLIDENEENQAETSF